MPSILYKFKILMGNMTTPVMYSKLNNGELMKTYMKGMEIVSEPVDIREYASGLAHIMLRPDPKIDSWTST